MPRPNNLKRYGLWPLLAKVAIAGVALILWAQAAQAQHPRHSDATHEWLLLQGVTSGISPFEDVSVLADKFQVPYEGVLTGITHEKIIAYRTPGALVLMSPLLLVEWFEAQAVLKVVGLAGFLWMLLGLIPRYCGVPVERLIVPLVLASLSAAFGEATHWGGSSVVVAVLVTLTLIRQHLMQSGIPLALGALLKPFAGLLIVPFVTHRPGWRTALMFLGSVLLLTVAGSITFGLSPWQTVQLFGQGSQAWLLFDGNLSLAAVLARAYGGDWYFPVFALTSIAGIAVFSRRHPLSQSLAVAVCVSILVSPLSWVSYDVIALPVVVWLWTRWRAFPVGGYVALGWLAVHALAVPIAQSISPGIARGLIVSVRILITVALALAPLSLWADTRRPILEQSPV